MHSSWCARIDSYLQSCHVEATPLTGMTVWVRRSRRDPFSDIGCALENALRKYGARIETINDLSFDLQSEHGRTRLTDIDAFVMLAATVGVSAEALELAHVTSKADPSLKDRLHVSMPEAYREGFIRKRLSHHGVSLDLYADSDLDAGNVCMKAINRLVEQKRQEEMIMKTKAMEFNPKIGIVTALPIEYKAMTSILKNPRPQRIRQQAGKLQEYVHGTLPAFDGGDHDIVVTLAGVGNNLSAAITQQIFSTFMLDEVLMVGIAGGIPRTKSTDPDIRLGDVVVSGRTGIVQYDMIKQKADGAEPNHPPRPPGAAWFNRATSLINSAAEMTAFTNQLKLVTGRAEFRRPPSRTDSLVDDSDPQNPIEIKRPKRKVNSHAFAGPVGSANRVVKSHRDREELREKYKLIAVEMEGAGVADAAMENGKPFFVIRGICDYANTGKNDVWHPYAAMAAAVFAAKLIESMPLASSK